MWHQVIAVLGFLLFLNLVSSAEIAVNSDIDVDKAVNWAKNFFKQAGPLSDRGGTTNSPQNKFENYTKCYTDQQEDGVCAKQSLCNKEQKKIDPTTRFTYREADDCHFMQICCPIDQVRVSEKIQAPYVSQGCGYSNPGAHVFRSSEGDTKNDYADFGEFRWMVALLKTGSNNWVDENYIGGGTLIHPSVVMTAAHKVMNLTADKLKCRAGEWETQNEHEINEHQDRLVEKIIAHKEFYSVHAQNDIALLIVQEPFVIAPHIDVACLSPVLPPAGTECYSMGWGEDFTKSNKYANILKKIPLPLVSASTCEMQYKKTRLTSKYTLHESLTCAGGEARVDTCMGDGGSSLVCPIGDKKAGRFKVVGMVAYGLECGTKNLPGVYVNVPYLYNWVNQQMSLQRLDKSYVY